MQRIRKSECMAKRINPRTMRAIVKSKQQGLTTDQCVAKYGVSKSTVEHAVSGHRRGVVASKIVRRPQHDDVDKIVHEMLASMTATITETLRSATDLIVRRKVDALLAQLGDV